MSLLPWNSVDVLGARFFKIRWMHSNSVDPGANRSAPTLIDKLITQVLLPQLPDRLFDAWAGMGCRVI